MSSEQIFSFQAPANVMIGPGAIGQLPELVRSLGKRTLVISDPGIAAAGILDRVRSWLHDAGIATEAFTNVEPNPSVETVNAAFDVLKQTEAEFLVGLGGGSAMDVAKVASVLARFGGTVHDYEGVGKVPGPGMPAVAIPTTAGTGSEVTVFAVITDRQRKFKMTVGSPYLIPPYAICDSELTLSMPPGLTAATGMDALTHGIECYVNRAYNPIAKALALEAMRLIGPSLRTAYANGRDLPARTSMLLASTIAGMAFTRTRLGNVHAMSHPLGAHFDVPHGVANAVLLPYVMAWNLPACLQSYPQIAAALGERVDELPADEASQRAVDAVRRLNRDVGIPDRLRDVGVMESAIPQMATDAMKSGNVLVNPRDTTYDDIVHLFEVAY